MSPRELRSKCVELLVGANDGHCGSVMSLIEILCAIQIAYDLKTDKLIISKAHGGMAVYPILAELGLIEDKDLASFRKRGGLLTMYPNNTIPGVPATLGSMGNGLGIAAGIALAQPGINVICVMGEGELYEGSVWEALLFIRHYRLKNVKIIVDRNEMIVLGNTEDLLALEPLETKFKAFGFSSCECDGHDVGHLTQALYHYQVVIANTIKGRGVPQWEGKPESHYWIRP